MPNLTALSPFFAEFMGEDTFLRKVQQTTINILILHMIRPIDTKLTRNWRTSFVENIAKGTRDPRVEFISQVITQILIKQLQNFD